MSIERTMFIGLSGMNANGQALNVVGDNIANMNTIGFKGGRSVFEEMLGQSLIGSNGVSMLGGGVGFAGVEKLFQQGALLGTGVATDLAITGEGFFALEGDRNGATGQFFTRAGQFHLDAEGYLTNPGGLKLLGYGAGADGVIGSSIGALKVDDAPYAPNKTSSIQIGVNLDASADAADPFDLAALEKSDFTTDVTIYDELGKPYQATVHFSKTADSQWSYNVVVDGDLVEANPPVDNKVIASGTLEFQGGKLANVLSNPSDFTPKGGQPQDLTFDFAGSTQFDTEKSGVSKIEQDGYTSGTFQDMRVDPDGTVVGSFSNGKERVLGQVALARFRSTAGLSAVGGGLFQGTIDSGSVTLGAPGTSGRGGIQGGALEQSTVDIAQEFTQMILAQRGYQANSRSISTADQMLQEAVNLKR